ncbi:hypothetical protein Cgig2_006217 [Carnegiea gigantea]|uniref:Uncharacterized protein n=1 Tax=Carnegiea gigantea TaxID=171969 RepID=A0A9Q1QS21_9CARY|nr:hypothetical protein Cgig2_006217 [Carnegiea gigantea]
MEDKSFKSPNKILYEVPGRPYRFSHLSSFLGLSHIQFTTLTTVTTTKQTNEIKIELAEGYGEFLPCAHSENLSGLNSSASSLQSSLSRGFELTLEAISFANLLPKHPRSLRKELESKKQARFSHDIKRRVCFEKLVYASEIVMAEAAHRLSHGLSAQGGYIFQIPKQEPVRSARDALLSEQFFQLLRPQPYPVHYFN